VVSGQWSVVSGQWSVVSGQWFVGMSKMFFVPIIVKGQIPISNSRFQSSKVEVKSKTGAQIVAGR